MPWLEVVFADGGYGGATPAYQGQAPGSLRLELVRRDPATRGFRVLAKRWVVERTFAWLGRDRRLSAA